MSDIYLTIALTVILAIYVVLYLRTLSLDQIRAKVYEAFVEAERQFEHGENDDKLLYAVEAARAALEAAPIPTIVKAIIAPLVTTENLKKIISAWYQQVKILVQG
jgi:hypothetical protein